MRTWRTSASQIVIAALSIVALWLAFLFALRSGAHDVFSDANLRATVSDDAWQIAASMQSQHRPLSTIGQVVVTKVRLTPGFDAAVVNDAGKLIAGSSGLVAGASLLNFTRFFGRGHVSISPGARVLYARRPPWVEKTAFVRSVFGPPSLPTSRVRINGAWIVISTKNDPFGQLFATAHNIALVLLVIGCAITWLVSQRMLSQMLRPVDRVRAALQRLAHSDYSRLESVDSPDELSAPVVEAYNAAASEMAAIFHQRSEVEAKIRQFVADAGHELRTPLAVIMGYVELLKQGKDPSDGMATRIYSEIHGQGERMRLLIQKLLLLTKLESQEPRDIKILDAADVAGDVVASFRAVANGSTLQANFDHDAFLRVSESELREAIENVIDNALKYAPGATIVTDVRAVDSSVVVSIRDDGPGMSPDVRARAFERFSRGESGGAIAGSGLGLAIVERAVKRAGGLVSLQTEPGKGTVIEMRFPAWQPGVRT